MGFFDQFGKNMQNAGRATVNKTRELADISKLNNQINDNNTKISQLYMEIGMNYYKAHLADPEPALAEYVTSINTLKQQNEEYTEQIQDLKGLKKCPYCQQIIPKTIVYCSGCGNRVAPEDVDPCPNCGAFVKKGMLFCSKCGTRMPNAEAEPEPVPVPAQIFCASCGAVVPEGDMFCSQCGHRVGQEMSQFVQAQPLDGAVEGTVEENAAGAVDLITEEIVEVDYE